MATIPANNNTGLYNTSGVPAVTGNDITVSGNVNANNVNAVNTVNAGTDVNATGNVNVGDSINADSGVITNDLTVGGTIYGTFSGNISGNLVVPGSNTQVLFNNSGNAGASSDFTFNNSTKVLDVNGNVVANYFIGDGSQLTGLPAVYGNANVAAYLASGTNTSNVITTGNVSGTYILGDGSQLTGLPATYGNANVNAHLAAFGSNTIVTTGNITGGYFIGNGSQLTGITGTGNYSNSNVVSLLSAFGSNTIVTTGNITGGNIIGNGQALTNLPGANVTGTVANATHATVADSANAVAGANVTGTVALATSATTAGTVTTAAQPNITSVGTLTSLTTSGNVDVGGSLNTDDVTSTGNVTIFGNQVITGNLTVQGTTTTINSNTITTNDKTITVANNQSTGANVNGAGLEAGNPAVATFLYDDATTTWKSDIGLSAVGNITGSYILGNGSQLTGLPDGYSNADVNAHLAAFGSNTIVTTGNISGNIVAPGSNTQVLFNNNGLVGANPGLSFNKDSNALVAFGNVQGSNVVATNSVFASGNVTGANLFGTVRTAAQTSITSLGTLTNLGVTGNITAGGILTDGYYYANGTPVTFGGTYGDANVTTLLGSLGSNVISSTANITTTANVSGAYVIGNGSALSSITGANITGTVANATYATSAGSAVTATDAAHATVADTANAVAGANVTGTVANATYATSAGTASTSTTAGLATYVTANAQANITSVGTLTSLATSGNVDIGGNLNMAGRLYDTSGVFQVDAVGNIVLAPTGSVVTAANIVGGNLTVTGGVTAGANISGNYILGNGSLLTGVTGTYGNTNVAAYLSSGTNSSNIITTGNVTGTYITTTGAAGNITGANYITGNYFVGNGSLLTGITTSYNNSNVTTLLAALGANVISSTANITTTANISGSYILGNGSQLTGITPSLSGNLAGNIDTGPYYIQRAGGEVLMGNVWVTGTLAANTISAPAGDYVTIEGVIASNGLTTAGNITGANVTSNASITAGTTITATGNITGGNITTAGKVIAGAVTYANTDGTTGQVLTTYGNGVTYFSTVSGGGGSPGGSDTQIQYNDGGSFGGNVAMTFDDSTGNIGLGNLIINAQQVQTIANANVALSSSLTPNPGRVVLGSGYNGNTSPAYDLNANLGRSSRFLLSDSYSFTDGNSVSRGVGVQNYYTLNANVTSTNARINGLSSSIAVGGGASGNTISGTLTSVIGTAGTVTIGGGTSGNLTGLGNTTVQYASGVFGLPQINAGSTGGNIYGFIGFVNNFGTANSAIGLGIDFQGSGTYGNTYGVYMPGATNNHGYTNSNNARNANYYFLKNEDNHSYSQLGQLKNYQETEYALTSSSGAVAVDKNNGQVQFFTVSEDATMSFSNFVVSSTVSGTTRYMTDTVTVIVQQDVTGRTITMPTPDATYKYAGGSNTVPTTADSVSMISITAIYNSVTAATQYLITISPEFS